MNKALQILAKKNIRITPMRQLILAFFMETPQAIGLVELETVFPKSDRITMYRTLKTFEEKGILHSIVNGSAEVKYALCPEHCSPQQHQDLHPHFQCTQCNQIVCLEMVVIPFVPLPSGYTTTEREMTIKGICPNCQS